eukprot:1188599-Prorocentrum_minimum.AAC.2
MIHLRDFEEINEMLNPNVARWIKSKLHLLNLTEEAWNPKLTKEIKECILTQSWSGIHTGSCPCRFGVLAVAEVLRERLERLESAKPPLYILAADGTHVWGCGGWSAHTQHHRAKGSAGDPSVFYNPNSTVLQIEPPPLKHKHSTSKLLVEKTPPPGDVNHFLRRHLQNAYESCRDLTPRRIT